MVQTGEGALLLTQIQPAGKKAMTAAEWLKAPDLTLLGPMFGGGADYDRSEANQQTAERKQSEAIDRPGGCPPDA